MHEVYEDHSKDHPFAHHLPFKKVETFTCEAPKNVKKMATATIWIC